MMSSNDSDDLEVFVTIEAPLYPTESKEKLEKALSTFLETQQFKLDKRVNGIYLTGIAKGLESLKKFKDQIKKFQIAKMVRGRLIHNIEDDNLTTLFFNKQAAFNDKIALLDPGEDPPLGLISLSIVSNNLMKVIDWLTEIPSNKKNSEIYEERKREKFKDQKKRKRREYRKYR